MLISSNYSVIYEKVWQANACVQTDISFSYMAHRLFEHHNEQTATNVAVKLRSSVFAI